MGRKEALYRIEFHANRPVGQTGHARFRQCGAMVGFWDDVLDAFKQGRLYYWIEIFDEATDERLIGPLAPGEGIPRFDSEIP